MRWLPVTGIVSSGWVRPGLPPGIGSEFYYGSRTAIPGLIDALPTCSSPETEARSSRCAAAGVLPNIQPALTLKLEDPDPIAYHDEPIRRNGALVGRTTSGMYGHTFGACLAMGYVLREKGVTREWVETGSWDVELAGVRIPATAQLRPFYIAKTRT